SADLEETAHPGIRQVHFLLEAPAGSPRLDLEPFGPNAEPGLAAGTEFVQRSPKPGAEIHIGRAVDDLALGGEHLRIEHEHRVDALVLAERFEEDTVGMNRNHRIEQPTAERALAQPGVIGPDGFAERPQSEAEERNVASDAPMKTYRPPGVGRDAEQRAVAIRLEDARSGVIEKRNHAALS